MLEIVLVGLLVAGSVIFSAWRLLSAKLRLRVLDFAGPALGRLSEKSLARLRSRTLGQLAGGCGSCSHHKPTVSAISPGRNQTPGELRR
jgi:hypothetical protein